MRSHVAAVASKVLVVSASIARSALMRAEFARVRYRSAVVTGNAAKHGDRERIASRAQAATRGKVWRSTRIF